MTHTSPSSEPIYLIDGSGFIFRAFYALPPLTRPDGTPVGAVYGFVNMLFKLLEEKQPKYMAVMFDAGRTSFRNEIYDQYKANRDETPPDLIPQFPLIRQAAEAFGLPVIEDKDYEADDLLATYARIAREAGHEVIIVSSDKDLMQIVSDHVTMLDPMKNKIIDASGVIDKFGVPPEKVIHVQALSGDSTDNIPGIRGIGPKTAATLINEYGDLETLLNRANEIKQPKRRQSLIDGAEDARISFKLVTLAQDAPTPVPLDELSYAGYESDKLRPFLAEHGFKTVLGRLKNSATEDVSATPVEQGPQGTYSLVQDEKTLQGWIDRAIQAGHIALDTETTGLTPRAADLVGISLAIDEGEACYIPLRHRGGAEHNSGELDLLGTGDNLLDGQLPHARVMEMLKPLLEDPSVIKIAHNMKFDSQLFMRHGIHVNPVDDTMLLSFALHAGLHSHALDELALQYLAHEMIPYKQVTGTGKSQISFAEVPLAEACTYAAEDADYCLRLYNIFKPKLSEQRVTRLYETIERPLIPIIAQMEQTGVLVDKKKLQALSKDFQHRLADLESHICELAEETFNPGSPKQLGKILFEKMGLQGGKKSKTGVFSTSQSVLEPLADAHEIVREVLQWRQLSKLKSTYTDVLTHQINNETGRVHTSYSMVGAATGRLSSSEPNLQNIPIRTEEGRKIRQAFIAPEGSKIVSIDYSQIELRLVAEVAGIKALQEAFKNDQDIHALTASQVFGIKLEDVDAEHRRRAKAINFGIIYGQGAWGLAQQLGISRSEASDFIKNYLDRFSEIRDYIENTKQFAREHGFVRTLFGRKVNIAGIDAKNPNHRAFAERQAVNAPLQGTAADILKRAMIRIPPAFEKENLSAKMMLQVHDELVFEIKQEELDRTITCATDIMENVADLSVPLKVEAGIGDNWDQAH